MDDEKLCMISIAVVIVMVIGLAGKTYVDEEGWPWEKDIEDTEILLIQEGDEVSIDYTGSFVGSDGGSGPVFDTSEPEIARNESIPKSISFQEKPTYDDLTFTVGDGQMIKGFDESVRGRKEGDSFTVSVSPENAYGPAFEERIYHLNATQVIPLRETMSREVFDRIYPIPDVENTVSFIHPFWNWDVDIFEVDVEEVTIMHRPVYGQNYRGFSWNTTIVDISTERNVITLQHEVSEIDITEAVPFDQFTMFDPVWTEKAIKANEAEPPTLGFITSLGGQITIDFNREVQGKTLLFQITINSIKRG
ncbi:MAG: FKBP-type peptidyl-prolyl cis-trans isomerase [Candidatus Thermoplasmatota archaeon]|nr:FKBP-type peptidyl-prolyl cis-trans isomerase [Candidatus Thermoplasmatota archaeon]